MRFNSGFKGLKVAKLITVYNLSCVVFNAFESSVLCMFLDILTDTDIRDTQENPVEMTGDLSFGFRVR